MKKEGFRPKKRVFVVSQASVVGKQEREGPIGPSFDLSKEDDFGMDTWEKAESEMQRLALGLALSKGGFTEDELDAMLAGDLINQCISSNFGLLDYNVPYLGLFGACSTCAEGLLLGSLLLGGDVGMTRCAAVTSSHYCSAERQFRFPLEYGGQRTPTAQWTVTGAGAFLLSSEPEDALRSGKDPSFSPSGGQTEGQKDRSAARQAEKAGIEKTDSPHGIGGEYVPEIVEGMPGCALDRGINDVNNMGAAMAPAAADTLSRYFQAGHRPEDFDLIITGDLGWEGSGILIDLMHASGYDIGKNHADCGKIIYHADDTDKHAGGSGCGCSAVVMAANILTNLREGRLRDVLFLGTGALMNPMSLNQKLTIPGVAHLVRLRGTEKREIERLSGKESQ